MAQLPPEKPKPVPTKPVQKAARAAEKKSPEKSGARELEPAEVTAYLRRHPDFLAGRCDTGFIEANPDLFTWKEPRDRANKLLNFLAEITVNDLDSSGFRPWSPPACRARLALEPDGVTFGAIHQRRCVVCTAYGVRLVLGAPIFS